MALHGLSGIDTVIIPTNAKPLLKAVSQVATSRQKRTLVREVEKSMVSIEHKLNIVRYNAGLIQNMNEEDYLRFRHRHLYPPDIDVPPATANFKDRCLFTMTDIKEYRLFFTFFVETFAASAFSLLDVCAYLLKDLYYLQFVDGSGNPRNVSFVNAMKEPKIRNNNALYRFLSKYRPKQTHSVDWIEPLKNIRNTTTHSPITDVCRLPPDSDDGNLYTPVVVGDFLLYDSFFQPPVSEPKLKEFVEKCFDGLEEFVEELYDQLRQEVEKHGFLPVP